MKMMGVSHHFLLCLMKCRDSSIIPVVWALASLSNRVGFDFGFCVICVIVVPQFKTAENIGPDLPRDHVAPSMLTPIDRALFQANRATLAASKARRERRPQKKRSPEERVTSPTRSDKPRTSSLDISAGAAGGSCS